MRKKPTALWPYHRQRRIIAQMQHGDGDDEGEIEPVGDEDMRLFPLDDGHQEDQQIGHPDDRQPQIGVPLRLGIFLGLGHAEQVAGAGDQNEEIVADDDKPGREIARQARAAGLLHHVERGCDQHVAAEGKDHRRRMQRPQSAEAGPWQVEIERGPGELRSDQKPDRKSGDTPEHRHHGGEFDRAHIVIGPAVDFLRRQQCRAGEIPVHNHDDRRQAGGARQEGVKGERRIQRLGRGEQAQKCRYRKDQHQTGLAVCHRFFGLRLGHGRASLLRIPASMITASRPGN